MRNSKLLRWSGILLCWLMPLLVVGATTFLWFNDATLTKLTDQPQQWLGVITTVVIWALLLAAATLLLRLRGTSRQLESLRLRRELETATLAPPDERTVLTAGLRSVPAWMVIVLGVVVTIVLTAFTPELLTSHEQSGLWLGMSISVVVWMLVLANTANRIIARRTRAEARAARRGEARALETVQSIGGVLISSCSPDGSRHRFNEAFRKFTGLTDDKLNGRGWLDCVQPDDREQLLGTIVNHKPRPREHLKLEYMLRDVEGEYRWVCEHLNPRFGPDGALLEYIACATDISTQVQNETEHEESASALQEEIERLQQSTAQLAGQRDELMSKLAEAEQQATEATRANSSAQNQLEKVQRKSSEQVESARNELKQLKSKLKSLTKERETARAEAERAGTNAARLEQEVSNLKAGEATLRAELTQARDDLKRTGLTLAERSAEFERASGAIARQEQAVEALQATERALRDQLAAVQPERDAAREERDEAQAEARRLADKAAALEQTIEELRRAEQELRGQIEENEARHEKSRSESEDARRTASQHRAKINRLTARCEELEQQIASLDAVPRPAALPAAPAIDEAADGPSPLDRELSAELSLNLSSIARINEQLRQSTLDEMQRSFLENAQASIDAMSSLVNSALGDGDHPSHESDVPPVRAFDVRAAAKGACDLLAATAEQRKIKLRHEVDIKVPPLVVTDPVRLRRVLMYLLNSALHVVNEGEVALRLSAEGVLSAHATIRFEISHPSARVAADRMEEIFSLKSVGANADPSRRQAAEAWRMISELQGQFAFNLPENGGFSVWFNLTLPRLTAAGANAGGPAAHAAPAQHRRPAAAVPDLTDEEPSPLIATATEAPPSPAAHTPPAPATGADAASSPARSSNPAIAPRMPQELLESNLGPVLELGADSARILVGRVPRGQVTIELPAADGTLSIDAEVLSSDRSGVRKHEVVLRFLDVNEAQRKKIMQVVFDHRAGATLMPMDTSESS